MGGNVFAGKTADIAIERITPTLTAYFNELKDVFPNKANIFNEQQFIPLGSVRKKDLSGDIDLGVSSTDILDFDMSDSSILEWGVKPADVQSEFDILTKRARTATPRQLKMKAFLKCLTIHINQHSPNVYCQEKKISDGNIFSLYPQVMPDGAMSTISVQIDWMIGDIEWLKFSYYSSAYPEDSNVKGLHRTQLMLAAFQIANLSFGHIAGVKDKSSGLVVATSPAQALSILSNRLGFKITASDAENYYTLHMLLNRNMRASDYTELINIYFKILDSTRTDIPDNLQAEWVKCKDLLGLTGKFLPENSALRKVA
jgi:hypothetical protein